MKLKMYFVALKEKKLEDEEKKKEKAKLWREKKAEKSRRAKTVLLSLSSLLF